MDRSAWKKIGLASIILSLLVGAATLTLSGILFRPASPNWNNNPWGTLGTLMITCMIVAFVFGLIAIIGFATGNIIALAITIIILLISLLFVWAIGIMALIGAQAKGFSTTFGCNTQFDGFFTPFRWVDTYINNVDTLFCSPSCPCYIANPANFTIDPNLNQIYRTWTTTTNPAGATNFTQCPANVQNQALASAVATNSTYYNQNFNQTDLVKYFAFLEREFQCSGWCGRTFYNPSISTAGPRPIAKYMFSDINMGPPPFIGCVNKLVDWITPLLTAFGSLALFLGLLQLIALIAALMMCFKREKGGTYVERRPVTVVERREPVVAVADRQ